MILGQKTRFWPNFGPRNEHFSAPKTTRKQTCYHDNQATVFRKLHFFFSIPIKYWQKNYAGWKINHWRCENEQKKFSDNFSKKSHFFCIVPPSKNHFVIRPLSLKWLTKEDWDGKAPAQACVSFNQVIIQLCLYTYQFEAS